VFQHDLLFGSASFLAGVLGWRVCVRRGWWQ